MRAVSLWQPWASLVACGAKPFETRHFPPPPSLIGQTIAIHAAKRIDRGAVKMAEELVYGQHPEGGHALAAKLCAPFDEISDDLMQVFGKAAMPAGCIVCLARLDAGYKLGDPLGHGRSVAVVDTRGPGDLSFIEIDAWGDYSPGRWAWQLSNVKPLAPPVAALGRQQIGWELPQGWLAQ